MKSSSKIELNIGILGASGYTGVELVRLLTLHPNAKIKFMTAYPIYSLNSQIEIDGYS